MKELAVTDDENEKPFSWVTRQNQGPAQDDATSAQVHIKRECSQDSLSKSEEIRCEDEIRTWSSALLRQVMGLE